MPHTPFGLTVARGQMSDPTNQLGPTGARAPDQGGVAAMDDVARGGVARLRVLVVLGTRPEAIKLAPVVRTLRARPETFDCRVCQTGQHREMLAQTLAALGVSADYDLALMRPNQRLADLAADAMRGIADILDSWRPDRLVVQGDTATAFAAALAGFYARVPVAHVEAGLRTGDLSAPFPEEGNRQLIGRIAAYHFAPTNRARANLLAEGVAAADVLVTGNTGIDALLAMRARLDAGDPALARAIAATRTALRFDPATAPFVLVTGHRRENFGDGMDSICRALRRLATARPDLHIVYPVHLNPNVREPVHRHLADLDRIDLIAPIDYPSLVWLMARARLVLTDSGGIQEEAPSLGKPVLVMRETTERQEAIDAGTALLVGTDADRIVGAVTELLDDPDRYAGMARAHNPFGDGHAAERIADTLLLGETALGKTALGETALGETALGETV